MTRTPHAPLRWLMTGLLLVTCAGVLASEADRMIEQGRTSTDAETRIRYFTEAIRLAPGLWSAWASRAEAHLAANALNAAVADATQAIKLDASQWLPWAVRANARLALREFAAAAEDATQAIERKPGMERLHAVRAEAYRHTARFTDAVDEATTALMIDARSKRALATRAAARIALGRRVPALEDLDAVISLYGDYLWAIDQRARLLADMKRYTESLRDCERLASLDPQNHEPLALKASILAGQGKFDEAIAVNRAALDRAPGRVVLWLHLGDTQCRAKRWSDAMASYAKAISLQPDYALAFAHRAEAHRLTGDYARAIADSALALKHDANCTFAYATRGAALSALEEWDSAITDLSSAIAKDSTYLFALRLRTRAYTAKHEWTRAVADAKRLLELAADDEDRSDAYIALGVAYRGKGLFQRSIQVLTDAIRIAPESSDAYFCRANTYRMAGRTEEAVPDCDAGLKLTPESAFGHLLRGVSYFQMSKYGIARSDIARALQFDTKGEWLAWAQAYLAEIARQEKQYDSSVDHATRALAARPKLAHPMAYVVRAASRRAKGLYAEAIADATAAIRIRKGFAYAYAERGAARRALRHYSQAIADCGRAISFMPFLKVAYYERGFALLGQYEGEGIEHAGEAAVLPAILSGLGEFDMPFELAQTAPQAPKTARSALALGATHTPRPYVPEPVKSQGDAKASHPLDRAVADFTMLLGMGYSTRSTTLGLSRCLHVMGRFREADAACGAELAKHEDADELYLARAMARYALGEVSAGRGDARRGVAARPKEPAALLTAAYGDALAGEWAKCRAACEAALALGPTPTAHARLLLLWFAATMHERPAPGQGKLSERAAGLPAQTTDWPIPIVRALAGKRELAALAAGLPRTAPPHLLKDRLGQALYYFAMADLGAGRLAQAKDKLKRSVSLAAGHNIEFCLANSELKRPISR